MRLEEAQMCLIKSFPWAEKTKSTIDVDDLIKRAKNNDIEIDVEIFKLAENGEISREDFFRVFLSIDMGEGSADLMQMQIIQNRLLYEKNSQDPTKE